MPVFPSQGGSKNTWGTELRNFFAPLFDLATGARVAGQIVSADIADGTIVDADIAAGAGIVDSKLATIATAGKVSDSALSSNVALENITNKFTALQLTDAINYVIGAGTANAHTATFNPPFTALVDGMEVSIRAFVNNDGGPATLKVDGTAATPIKKVSNATFSDPGAVDINIFVVHHYQYHAGSNIWILLNPATAVTTTSANVFTADQEINKASPLLRLHATNGTLDNKKLDILTTGGNFVVQRRNDDGTFKGNLLQFDINDKLIEGIVPLARLEGPAETSVIINFGVVLAHSTLLSDLTITSAAPGDMVLLSHGSQDIPLVFRAVVIAAGTVRIMVTNTATVSKTALNDTFRVKVITTVT